MSFGFSAGNFITAGTLIKDVVYALNGVATSEYRELERELHGLQRALNEIERLKPQPGQEADVNSVKVAVLMCQHPLEEFKSKLKNFERLSGHGQQKRLDVVKGWGQKIHWNLSMSDEVQKLRAYVGAHVGSLNMRLTTLGLATMAVTSREASERGGLIQARLEDQAAQISAHTAKMGTLYTLISGQALPRVQSLIELAEKTTEAIIRDQFRSGPGHDKVHAGEYELFVSEDSSQLITEQTGSLLRPGANTTMAMLAGRYHQNPIDIGPKPGCKSKRFTKSDAGGMICEKCKTWFGISRRVLPRPFRFFLFEALENEGFDNLKPQKKRKRTTENLQRDIFKEMREQRKWFKNLCIHNTETDMLFDFLQKRWQHKDAVPPKKAKLRMKNRSPVLSSPDNSTNAEFSNAVSQTSPGIKKGEIIWKATFKLILEELHVKADELQDSTVFADLGMDSLHELVILYRLEEELKLVLLPELIFSHFPTVRELRTFIEGGCIWPCP